jgi:hypothetical protein
MSKAWAKAFWVIVFWLAASFVVDEAGGDLSNPAVFGGVLAVGAAVALWLTWGDGKKSDQQ